MRFAGVLVAVLLGVSAIAPSAHADPLPFEIVRMLPETQQVLVYDRAHNKHLLLEPGSTFEDYAIVEIDGLSMTVQKQAERFVVYPREARTLALTLFPRAHDDAQPPVIYGKSTPVPAPTQVAAAPKPAAPAVAEAKVDRAKTLDKTEAAQGLALVLTESPRPAPRAPSAPLSHKLQR